jgi:hypothetical protein
VVYLNSSDKGVFRMRNSTNRFSNGQTVSIKETGEEVTILKWQYVKNMKRYSYTVKERPGTFYFEEELQSQ